MRIQIHAVKLIILALGITASFVLGDHRIGTAQQGHVGFAQTAGAGAAAVHQHHIEALPGRI